jgi:hypothetical protein
MPCVAHLPGRTELYLLQSDIASNPYCEVRTTVSPLWKVRCRLCLSATTVYPRG